MKSKHDVRIDRDKLHPLLDYKLTRFLNKCEKQGIYLIITEGFRTKEYQDKLYSKGRTVPGSIITNAKGSDYASQHQFGIAIDIAINHENAGKLYDETLIKKAAKIAKSVGLGWGGDWKTFRDTPHFYLKKWGSTTSKLKKQYYIPENFIATWAKKVSGTKNGLNVWNSTRTKVIVKKLKNGTKLKVLYSKGLYSKVCYAKDGKKIIGWVKKKYIK